MTNICPCCKRRIPTPRLPKQGADKRLEQDIALAQVAIASLVFTGPRIAHPHLDSLESQATRRIAMSDERKRLQSALIDHRLLWAIYRRADKGQPYYEVQS